MFTLSELSHKPSVRQQLALWEFRRFLYTKVAPHLNELQPIRKQVFVSYSWASDSYETVTNFTEQQQEQNACRLIAHDLEYSGLAVWLDIDKAKVGDLLEEDKGQGIIEQAVKSADIYAILGTPVYAAKYQASNVEGGRQHIINFEVERIYENRIRKQVLPLLVAKNKSYEKPFPLKLMAGSPSYPDFTNKETSYFTLLMSVIRSAYGIEPRNAEFASLFSHFETRLSKIGHLNDQALQNSLHESMRAIDDFRAADYNSSNVDRNLQYALRDSYNPTGKSPRLDLEHYAEPTLIQSANGKQLSMRELFQLFQTQDNESSAHKKVRMIGEKGSGNSTLCHYLAYAWARPHDPALQLPVVEKFDYVFRLTYQCLNNNKDDPTFDLIQWIKQESIDADCWRRTHLTDEKLRWVIDNERDSCLFLLDGSEHLVSYTPGGTIARILKDLSKIRFMLITSDLVPSADTANHLMAPDEIRVENLGLDAFNQSKMITTQCTFYKLSPVVAQSIIQFILSQQELQYFCRLPKNLQIVCDYFNKSLSSAKIDAEMVVAFSQTRLLYYYRNFYLKPYCDQKLITVLEALALATIGENAEVAYFSHSEIEHYVINAASQEVKRDELAKIVESLVGLGLLKAKKNSHGSLIYCFTQTLYLDFCAASAIVKKLVQLMAQNKQPQAVRITASVVPVGRVSDVVLDNLNQITLFLRKAKYQSKYHSLLKLIAGILNESQQIRPKSTNGSVVSDSTTIALENAKNYFWDLMTIVGRDWIGLREATLWLYLLEQSSVISEEFNIGKPEFCLSAAHCDPILVTVWRWFKASLSSEFSQLIPWGLNTLTTATRNSPSIARQLYVRSQTVEQGETEWQRLSLKQKTVLIEYYYSDWILVVPDLSAFMLSIIRDASQRCELHHALLQFNWEKFSFLPELESLLAELQALMEQLSCHPFTVKSHQLAEFIFVVLGKLSRSIFLVESNRSHVEKLEKLKEAIEQIAKKLTIEDGGKNHPTSLKIFISRYHALITLHELKTNLGLFCEDMLETVYLAVSQLLNDDEKPPPLGLTIVLSRLLTVLAASQREKLIVKIMDSAEKAQPPFSDAISNLLLTTKLPSQLRVRAQQFISKHQMETRISALLNTAAYECSALNQRRLTILEELASRSTNTSSSDHVLKQIAQQALEDIATNQPVFEEELQKYATQLSVVNVGEEGAKKNSIRAFSPAETIPATDILVAEVQSLQRLSTDKDWAKRRQAAESLGRQQYQSYDKQREIDNTLLKLLNDDLWYVRICAIKSIGVRRQIVRANELEMVELLVRMLKDDPDQQVRLETAKTLGKLSVFIDKSKRFVQQAQWDALNSEDLRVRLSAAKAVLTQMNFSGEVAECVLNVLKESVSSEVIDIRRQSVGIIGELTRFQGELYAFSKQALIEMLYDQDGIVRISAVEVLVTQELLDQKSQGIVEEILLQSFQHENHDKIIRSMRLLEKLTNFTVANQAKLMEFLVDTEKNNQLPYSLREAAAIGLKAHFGYLPVVDERYAIYRFLGAFARRKNFWLSEKELALLHLQVSDGQVMLYLRIDALKTIIRAKRLWIVEEALSMAKLENLLQGTIATHGSDRNLSHSRLDNYFNEDPTEFLQLVFNYLMQNPHYEQEIFSLLLNLDVSVNQLGSAYPQAIESFCKNNGAATDFTPTLKVLAGIFLQKNASLLDHPDGFSLLCSDTSIDFKFSSSHRVSIKRTLVTCLYEILSSLGASTCWLACLQGSANIQFYQQSQLDLLVPPKLLHVANEGSNNTEKINDFGLLPFVTLNWQRAREPKIVSFTNSIRKIYAIQRGVTSSQRKSTDDYQLRIVHQEDTCVKIVLSPSVSGSDRGSILKEALEQARSYNPSVLDISDNKLTDTVLEVLLDEYEHQQTKWRFLQMSENWFTEVGLRVLFSRLRGLNAKKKLEAGLRYLLLDENCLELSQEFVKYYLSENALKQMGLAHVDLSMNYIAEPVSSCFTGSSIIHSHHPIVVPDESVFGLAGTSRFPDESCSSVMLIPVNSTEQASAKTYFLLQFITNSGQKNRCLIEVACDRVKEQIDIEQSIPTLKQWYNLISQQNYLDTNVMKKNQNKRGFNPFKSTKVALNQFQRRYFAVTLEQLNELREVIARAEKNITMPTSYSPKAPNQTEGLLSYQWATACLLEAKIITNTQDSAGMNLSVRESAEREDSDDFIKLNPFASQLLNSYRRVLIYIWYRDRVEHLALATKNDYCSLRTAKTATAANFWVSQYDDDVKIQGSPATLLFCYYSFDVEAISLTCRELRNKTQGLNSLAVVLTLMVTGGVQSILPVESAQSDNQLQTPLSATQLFDNLASILEYFKQAKKEELVNYPQSAIAVYENEWRPGT